MSYASLNETAQKLIKQYGVQNQAILHHSVEGTLPDANKPWEMAEGTVQDIFFTLVMTNIPKENKNSLQLGQHPLESLATTPKNGIIEQSFMNFITADLAVTPSIRDKITIGTDVWTIESVDRVSPDNETVVVYRGVIRK